jgi:hypothetical protein
MRNGLNDIRGQRRAEKQFYKREEKRRKQREKASHGGKLGAESLVARPNQRIESK